MEGQATRQKMCWNCEARVDMGVENCSSCGVYLSNSPLLDQSNDLSTVSRYEPPYRLVSNELESSIPDSPYKMAEVAEEEHAVSEGTSSTFNLSGWKNELTPLGCLLVGSVLCLFGLILFLFSENGTFTLQWNGDYWYLYACVGVPLLYFGWKSLDNIPGPEESLQ